MTEFRAEGLGAILTIANGVIAIDAGLAQRSLTGGKHLELSALDIIGLHIKPAKVMTNGEFILGTRKGKVNVIYTRKHQEEFEQAAELIRSMGIKDDESVKKLPFYSRKAGQDAEGAAIVQDPDAQQILDAAQRFQSWRSQNQAAAEDARAESRKVTSAHQRSRRAASSEPSANSQEFILDEEVFGGVIEVIGNRGTHPNVVPRDDEFTKLDVVGESNYQPALAAVAKNGPGEQAGWQYGFLAPEQDNPYDANAVAVYIITRVKGQPLDAEKVGYLPRAKAEELSPKLARQLVTKGRIVPLLLRLTGGTEDRPSYGVLAQAYCALVAD